MPQILPAEIGTRFDFGKLASKYRVIDAAEVGVDRGEFAEHFLKQWKSYGTLHLIDPYEPYGDSITGQRQWDHTPTMLQAIVRLAPFVDRCRFFRTRSPDCLRQFHPQWKFQFVYLDGIHDYAHVRREVEAWYDRIDAGGIVAGHDYCSPDNGVAKAVNEFAASRGLGVHVVADSIPSFYIVKP